MRLASSTIRDPRFKAVLLPDVHDLDHALVAIDIDQRLGLHAAHRATAGHDLGFRRGDCLRGFNLRHHFAQPLHLP